MNINNHNFNNNIILYGDEYRYLLSSLIRVDQPTVPDHRVRTVAFAVEPILLGLRLPTSRSVSIAGLAAASTRLRTQILSASISIDLWML